MAKDRVQLAETAATGNSSFDLDAFLARDLSQLPEEQRLLGPWAILWIQAYINPGENDKGKYTSVTVSFAPIHSFSVDREEIEAELDMDDLPELRHFMYVTTNTQLRTFRDLMGKFGVEQGPLSIMLEEARGQMAVATLTLSKKVDKYTGQFTTRLSNFRAYPDVLPSDDNE